MHDAPQSAAEPRSARWCGLLLRAAPITALIFFAAWCYIAVRPAHLWDDSEPEVLNQAWRLAEGKPIYKDIDSPPYILTAYPPVYMAATAVLLKLTGLSTLPGKFVSMLAALAIGLAFARLSREWLGERRQGWLLFALLMMIPAFLYNTARVQVQMLAVALSIWSLVFLLRGRLLDVALWSPLLAALAIYTKQSQVALPIAAGIYLLMRQPRRFPLYAASLAVMGLVPLVFLQQATNGFFLRHTVEWNALSYSFVRLVLTLLEHAGPGAIFLALAWMSVAGRVRERRTELLDMYFIAAFVIGIGTLGRIGAHTQYVVELYCMALLVLLRAGGFANLNRKTGWVCAQLVVLFFYTPVFMGQKAARALPAYRAAPEVYALLRNAPGPILSQQIAFPLFSGREPYIQLFHFADLARSGRWDESKLVRDIESRKFAYVITEFPIEDAGAWPLRHRERFNPSVRDAIQKHYWRAHVIGPYFLYRPRE